MDVSIIDNNGELFEFSYWPFIPRIGEKIVLDRPFEQQECTVTDVRYMVRENGGLAFVQVKVDY